MLEPEHLAGAAEAGLDFVADEKRAVFAAKLLRAARRNRPAANCTPLPCTGSMTNAATSRFASSRLQRRDVVERDARVAILPSAGRSLR